MSSQLPTKRTEERKHHKQRLPDGNLVEFLVSPDEAGAEICVIRGTMPAGSVVPLHSHSDLELFYLLEGSVESFLSRNGIQDWKTVGVGDVVTVPENTKHAWRNRSPFPATMVMVTTARMYEFLGELGKPVDPDQLATPPTREAVQEIFEAAARYGYWMGSPEENAAIGLSLK